jgi:hypothetical protein
MARQVVRLGKDARGNYKRDLGTPQKRFYLGKDSLEAQRRALKLEELWACVEKHCQRERATDRPQWDEVSSAIGMSVARGEDAAAIPFPADLEPISALTWIRTLETVYPGFKLLLPGRAAQRAEEGREEVRRGGASREVHKRLNDGIDGWLLAKPTASVGDALDAYEEYVKQKYNGSEHGVVELKYLRLVRDALKGSLADLDATALDFAQRHFERRPKGRRGVLAAVTCDTAISKMFAFLRWLDRQPRFGWRMPTDFAKRKTRVEVTPAEMAARVRPRTFSVDDLAVLYRHATARERCLMLFGLNCGFGGREVGTLQVEEVHLGQSHPHYRKVGDWIFRSRKKSGVYGEWRLWPETRQAVEYLQRIRPRSDQGELVLTKDGKPVWTPTARGNPNRFVANAWAKLLNRVRKDHADLPRLGFKYLRKTAATLVRRLAGGEAASMFLSHGRATADDLLDIYAAKPFGKVFKACRRLRKVLEPVFQSHRPFPEKRERLGGPEISVAKQAKIKAMRSQGFKVAKICEELGVAPGTVTKYGR